MIIKKKKVSRLDRELKYGSIVREKYKNTLGIICHIPTDNFLKLYVLILNTGELKQYEALDEVSKFWTIEEDKLEIQNDLVKLEESK